MDKKTLDNVVRATVEDNHDRVRQLINATAIIHDMLKNMPEPPKLTRWQRFTRVVRFVPGRIRDAWLVLKGDAYIEEY